MALSCTSRLWGLCLPISLGQTDVCTSGWAADGSAVAFAWEIIQLNSLGLLAGQAKSQDLGSNLVKVINNNSVAHS